MNKNSIFYKKMTFFTMLLVIILSSIFEVVVIFMCANKLIDYMDIEYIIEETEEELYIDKDIDIITVKYGVKNNCEKIEVSSKNKNFYAKNNCIIKKSNNELVLACKNSIIPNEVKVIGYYSFYGLEFENLYYEGALEEWCSIDFKGTFIGQHAEKIWFLNENQEYYLPEEIIIPNNVYSISKYCFDYFKQLKSITFHKDIKFVDEFAFYNCENLKKIVIDGEISDDAFSPTAFFYLTLDEFHLLNVKEHINLHPFIECEIDKFYYDGTLEEWLNVEIYTNKQQVLANRNKFYLKDDNDEYYLLTDLVIPESITKINNFTFANMDSIKSVFIHKNVTSIGANAFLRCDNLANLVIEEGSILTFIGHLAFMDCPLQQNLILPDTLNSLGNCPFENCANVRYVKMPYINSQYLGNIFGNTLDYITKFELVYNEYSGKTISKNYLNNLSNANVIIIDDEFEVIESNAFRNCNSLKDVYLPKNLKSIANYVFPDGVELENVYLNCSVDTYKEIIEPNLSTIFKNGFENLYINVDGVYEKVNFSN